MIVVDEVVLVLGVVAVRRDMAEGFDNYLVSHSAEIEAILEWREMMGYWCGCSSDLNALVDVENS